MKYTEFWLICLIYSGKISSDYLISTTILRILSSILKHKHSIKLRFRKRKRKKARHINIYSCLISWTLSFVRDHKMVKIFIINRQHIHWMYDLNGFIYLLKLVRWKVEFNHVCETSECVTIYLGQTTSRHTNPL